MAEANARYYATRDPLGAAGDFITAPEISQMFGEVVGGWLADIRARSGAADAIYVELGPGRGTLARDALKVLGMAGTVPDVHFVEGSPALREKQGDLLAGARFHNDVSTLPEDRPLLIVANEFFDALPVRQLVRTPDGWRERMVGLDGESLVPIAGDKPMDAAIPARFADLPPDSIVETCPAASAVMHDLAARIVAQGGAMIVFDYGYLAPQPGSTFQALSKHRHHDPFTAPGTADLTCHVDFAALADAARRGGARLDGMAEQGAVLMALGMGHRAAALARANPGQAGAVIAGLERLTAPDAMGRLFKAMALAAPTWPESAGFADAEMG
nr:SAM-dependent methyltransferase [Croceicoccus naphthovorans]